MSAADIRAQATKANNEAQQAWDEHGNCADYRERLAELTRLSERYSELTGRMMFL